MQSNSKKNIVVLTSRFPYPLEKGDKLRAYHQIRVLSAEFNIHLISTTDNTISENDVNELRRYCTSVHCYKLNRVVQLFNLIRVLFSRKPFQVGYFYQSWIKRKIHKLIKDINPDSIYCQLIRTTEYVKYLFEIPKSLDYMDALSKGMERRKGKESWLKNILIKSEHSRLLDYENSIFDYFDQHYIISDQDKEYILHRNNKKIITLSNGIDSSYFQSIKVCDVFDVGFVGNMSYPPNIQASKVLAKQILPLNSDLNLLISGTTPSKEVEALTSDKIKVVGWVDDIRTSYSAIRVFVAPLFIGTGQQNKLLEAMSMGVPCITTSMVNNAIGATPGEEILLANSVEKFSQQITKLLKDKELFNKISTNARRFVIAHFDWKAKTNELIENLKDNS